MVARSEVRIDDEKCGNFFLVLRLSMERLASESLTRDERKTLIHLLKKIGYEAAGTSVQSEQKA